MILIRLYLHESKDLPIQTEKNMLQCIFSLIQKIFIDLLAEAEDKVLLQMKLIEMILINWMEMVPTVQKLHKIICSAH